MAWRAVRVLSALALLGACMGSVGPVSASGVVTTQSGTINGASYIIQVPPNWNGTLVLYSHGYVVPGSANPAQDAGDPITAGYLLSNGYALAGSSYKSTGWAVKDALEDQIALLDFFGQNVGKPSQTIAWGHSLGGMITAGLVQRHPDRFAGALPMCGVLAGGVGVWNVALDAEFAFKTLLAPGSNLQLVNITDPDANLATAEAILAAAQQTPQGRARVALVSALGDIPGWFTPGSDEPASTDFASQEANQFLWDSQVDFPFAFAFRAELESRAGGNPSWNFGVEYRRQLEQSVGRDEVRSLYSAAGMNVDDDLRTLDTTRRVFPNFGAVGYLIRNIVYDGDIGRTPVLTLHTTGDGLVLNQDEQAYASVIDNQGLLRQTFVHRAGHCAFTPAETIAAFNALIARIQSGQWPSVAASDLNAEATALGPLFNVPFSPPGFEDFSPTRFPRPFALP